MAAAHAQGLGDAPRSGGRASSPSSARERQEQVERLVRRVGCGPDRIARRGLSVRCEAGTDATVGWLAQAGMAARTDLFARESEAALALAYAGGADAPDDLLHVTCTGYVSPSAAQRLVSRKGWGDRTRVTHVYHMGCYAAVPALRIARALAAPALSRGHGPPRVDVVHTELCSLHFDATALSPEQLVVQSLFADGSIRYVARAEPEGAGHAEGPPARGLRLLALREVLATDSADAMQWRPGDRAMRMVLARDVPDRIGAAIGSFAAALFAEGGLDFEAERSTAAFAVHPGGPKIIDRVQDALRLGDEQVAASRRVLRLYGNMSSATLPHIWADLAGDPACQPDTVVASFAFGPGLTIAGALFRKV